MLTEGDKHVVRAANDAFARWSAAPAADLQGREVTSALTGFGALLDEATRTGLTQASPDLLCTGPNGSQHQATVIASPIYDGGPHPRGLVVQFVETPGALLVDDAGEPNARDLRRANEKLLIGALREQALAEQAGRSAAEFRALLESMSEGVTVYDAMGRIMLLNPAGRSLLGAADADLSDRDSLAAFRWLDGASVEFERDLLPRVAGGHRFHELEMTLLRLDGVERQVVVSGSAVLNAHGETALVLLVYRDVTRITELERDREQVLSLVTHDLRGPLVAAKMGAMLLIRHDSTPERRTAVAARIVSSLDRMDKMIRDLLDSQWIGAGKTMKVTLVECDLTEIARDVVADLTTLHGDRFVLRGEPSLLGHWSPDALHRALWNLGANAVKYGAPGAPVEIAVHRADGEAEVAVHNQGPRIAPEDQARLFTPFSRSLSATKSTQSGWGLGLTVVRGCAEAHGGHVTVESDDDGTTFRIRLPFDPQTQQMKRSDSA